MNWTDLVPEHIAKEQVRFERRAAVARGIEAGATKAEIGRRIGRSGETVDMYYRKAKRQAGRRSPVERYLSELSDVIKLADAIKAQQKPLRDAIDLFYT